MGHAIQKLITEHTRMRRVLEFIRIQLDLLETGAAADLLLLGNALFYMRKYPSVAHHPREDLLFARLAERGGEDIRSRVEELRREHQRIYALEERLLALLAEVERPEARAELLRLGREYLTLQRDHSQHEERELFPRALKLLRQADWRWLARQSRRIDDPMFGRPVAERYRRLYAYLLTEAGQRGASLRAVVPGG